MRRGSPRVRPTCGRCTGRARRRSSPCAGSPSSSSGATSPRSWARPGPASPPSCTAWPGSTRSPAARSTSATPQVTGLGDAGLTKLRRDKVGFIFQQFNLLPTLTADENILLPLSIAGRKPDKQWYDTVIDTVGLARPPQPPPRPTLRRPTTTRRLRPRPGRPTRRHLRRRTHRQPRLPLRRRGPRLPAQLRTRLRPDHRHGHPRPQRRQLRRPRHLPRRRPDRRRDARPDRRGGARPAQGPRRTPGRRTGRGTGEPQPPCRARSRPWGASADAARQPARAVLPQAAARPWPWWPSCWAPASCPGRSCSPTPSAPASRSCSSRSTRTWTSRSRRTEEPTDQGEPPRLTQAQLDEIGRGAGRRRRSPAT